MEKFIGDRKFYKMVFSIAIPVMVQNFITNFVNMLDNIMVGQVGTEQMSGVAIVNQLLFVFNLAVFGAISGPGIFTAQFVGQKNHEGVRYTVRYKLYACIGITVLGVIILMGFQDTLINLFLTESDTDISIADTLMYAKDYLHVMLTGLIPFAITSSYAGTLRENGETKLPMYAGLIAVGVNLIGNYILIFGHFGAPEMGVVGAAIATVISRYVEMVIVIVWTHTHTEKNEFAVGLYSSFAIPAKLAKDITIKGLPLVLNEFLWSLGMSTVTQCYSTRGVDVIAAFNISNTIVNLFNVAMISMGTVVAIVIGQILGSGNVDEVEDTDRKLIAFAIMLSATLGLILIFTAPLFPMFYNTTDDIRLMAGKLMRIAACFMPVSAYLNAAYFTIRSGGKTLITFLFDSAFLWVVSVPVAFVLSRFTSIAILPMYVVVLALDFIKVTIGAIMLKKRIWIQNLVG